MDKYTLALKHDDNMKRNIAWGQLLVEVQRQHDGKWDAFMPLLVEALDSEYVDVLRKAVTQLGELREAAVVDKLISLLSYPDHHLRADVIKSLGLIGDERAFAPLVDIFADHMAEVMEAVARLDAPGAQAFIEARLKDESPYYREMACCAVERANYRKAIPMLLTMLDDQGVTSISSGPAHPTTVRDMVFKCLGKMKAEEALPVLESLLTEGANKGEVRSLIEFGGSEVIGITTKILNNSRSNESAKANAANILRQILIHEKPDDGRIGPALVKGLLDESPLVRRDACFAVSATHYEPAIPILMNLLKDKTETVGGYTVDGYAVYALTNMGVPIPDRDVGMGASV